MLELKTTASVPEEKSPSISPKNLALSHAGMRIVGSKREYPKGI